jgi:TRAP transporter TAXI family solute receptor
MGGAAAGSGYTLHAKACEAAIRDYFPDITTRMELSNVAQTVGRLQEGTADVACTSWGATLYYRGDDPPDYPTPHQNLRIMGLVPSGITGSILVMKDSPIQDISELKDKRLHTGAPPSSATERQINIALEAGYGFNYDDIEAAGGLVMSGGIEDAVEMLMMNDVDALASVNLHPYAPIMTAFASPRGARWLKFNEEALDAIVASARGLSRVTMPIDLYSGMTEEIPSYTAIFFLLTRADIPDDVIYNLCAAFYADDGAFFKAIGPAHESMDYITSEAGEEFEIPWHPGAKKFWWELWEKRGLL